MGIILRLIREILSKRNSLPLSLPSLLSTTPTQLSQPQSQLTHQPQLQSQLRPSPASPETKSPHVVASGIPLSLSLTRLAPFLSTTMDPSFNSSPTVPGPKVDDHLATLFSTELTV